MKLRNKKTGETINVYDYLNVYDDTLTNPRTWRYKSLAELNEEWEDYKPAEPLIKDEKAQKAIRAFCEVTQEKKRIFVIKQFGRGSAEFSVGGRYVIRLPLSYESMDALEDGRNYTLTELCGEEEE